MQVLGQFVVQLCGMVWNDPSENVRESAAIAVGSLGAGAVTLGPEAIAVRCLSDALDDRFAKVWRFVLCMATGVSNDTRRASASVFFRCGL